MFKFYLQFIQENCVSEYCKKSLFKKCCRKKGLNFWKNKMKMYPAVYR